MNIITQSKQTFEDYISNFTKNIKINGLKQLKEELLIEVKKLIEGKRAITSKRDFTN